MIHSRLDILPTRTYTVGMGLNVPSDYFVNQAEAYLDKHHATLTVAEYTRIARVIGQVRRGERVVDTYVSDVRVYIDKLTAIVA